MFPWGDPRVLMICRGHWGGEEVKIVSKLRLKGCGNLSCMLGIWVAFYLEIKERLKK